MKFSCNGIEGSRTAANGHAACKPRRREERKAAWPHPNRAKRLECAELAPAFNDLRRSKAGASSAHSKRFATTNAPGILAACILFALTLYAPRAIANPAAAT